MTPNKLYDDLTAKLDELEHTDNVNLVELMCTARTIQQLESEFPELGGGRKTSTLSQLVRDKE